MSEYKIIFIALMVLFLDFFAYLFANCFIFLIHSKKSNYDCKKCKAWNCQAKRMY